MHVAARWCLGGLVALAFLVVAAPAFSATIGATDAGARACTGIDGFFFEQYVVPAGNWTVTSWSTDQTNGTPGGQMALLMFRPTGNPNEYTVVGVSAIETITPGGLNTFTTSIPVRGNDVLGFWQTGATACATAAAASYGAAGPRGGPPGTGETVTFTPQTTDVLNISAVLTPSSGGGGGSTPVCTPTALGGCYETFSHQAMCSPSGQFMDLLLGQSGLDKNAYAGFYNAAYVKGVGLTCNAAGHTATGTKVNAQGLDLGPSDAGRLYDYFT